LRDDSYFTAGGLHGFDASHSRHRIIEMPKVIKIKRGLDIHLLGEPEKVIVAKPCYRYAVKPPDFHGLFPKLLVKEGDAVLAGTPLFRDKYREKILFASPVSGTITGVVRGEKRVLLEVRIEAEKDITYVDFGREEPAGMERRDIAGKLLQSGVWPVLRQRPYGIVANPDDVPKAIFVSCFDTAPLAPDMDFIVEGQAESFQTGLDALIRLTPGVVHLNLDANKNRSEVFLKAQGVRINFFSGPHPAGNAGTQIHHLDPVNKGEVVWYLRPQDVITIGRLFRQGRYDASAIIALTGSEVLKPCYYRIVRGTSIGEIVENNLSGAELRFISGHVLTGARIEHDGYLGFYDHQVTVIPEGHRREFLGWAMPGWRKYSTSRSFPAWLAPARKYRLDTNMNGAVRPIVMTGYFEKVFPMDIYPVNLIKAILAKDIDLMENLGIYEVEEEDFALCEFVDTSKMNIQQIVREGLDLVRKEMS